MDLLRHCGLLNGLKSQRGGKELVGICPFNEERCWSFHISTTKNGFNCFGCHRHGNILDLVAHKEGVTIREAALLVTGWFNIEPDGGHRRPSDRHVVHMVSADITGDIDEGTDAGTTDEDIVVANAPLTFELKGLDLSHPYLKERGLTDEAIDHFGLGYSPREFLRSGNSLASEGIREGDVVLVDPDSNFDDGKIYIVLLQKKHQSITSPRVYTSGRLKYKLVDMDGSVEEVDRRAIQIVGRVRWSFREY